MCEGETLCRALPDKPGEECGVFGMYDTAGGDVASTIYYGLFALQHRGQESCGIAVSDTAGPRGQARFYKGMGLVNEVFTPDALQNLQGNLGVGHVRYSTAGSSTRENAQPLVLNYIKGTLALAHNGNLVNAAELRREQERTGALFSTTIDSEVIACGIAKERVNCSSVEEAVKRTAARLKGGYALVITSPRKLIGVRDPHGLKPLCLGRKGPAWILASESCALSSLGAEFVRDIRPGELIAITADGLCSHHLDLPQTRTAHCVFEYIYFARLDSVIDGVSVYNARLKSGAALARSCPAKADLVVGVPDSGLTAAAGFSQESGIPFAIAFHKNSYVGRTFIKPTPEERQSAVQMKLSVLEPAVRGKRIVLVDDSLVRGTTMSALAAMLRRAGAREVHVRISSPPFLHPCYFGTDVPSNRQLIASDHSVEAVRRLIGADSLGYLSMDDLAGMTEGLPLCRACFDGRYPMEVPKGDIRDALENIGSR
ncbi:MAG TPA: amidophosphoribosyltransferase [Candidatus Lachnoclostridium stercoripullorum]|uniref:Amidophosphoribosyltransferase n=1 Tax=Candidatus Lachnoclostridium stercoripullorum TaxID=2838635 RepID=A0A9D1W5U9_9FIRM|nr:amidophosphoribosyltransferase [Candidatus Lachnoclostridium stercoripullorum]